MANYVEYKKKTFQLKKDATAWIKKTKKDAKLGGQSVKIETNYIPSSPYPWEGVILVKS